MAELRLKAKVAARGLDVEFDVAAGQVLAVLGPNGAGKSTVLHIIAGLTQPDSGFVRVGSRNLTDTDAGVHVPTHDRRVGLLLQDPLLFPHLSVLGNVAFAPRSRGLSRRTAADVAIRWLDEVGVADLAGRHPAELSGGQAQRVAIARVLAAEPDVLLIDEPLAGVDVAVATSVRAALRKAVAAGGRSTVLVTHDLLDAVALADRVLVLDNGKVAEYGPTAAVLAAPRSHFGARMAGVNLVRGTAAGHGVVRSAAGALWHGKQTEDLLRGQDAVAVFPPAAVAVYPSVPHGSPRNSARVIVAEIETAAGTVRVRGTAQDDGTPGLAADITVEAAADLQLTSGQEVWFTIKAQEVTLQAAVRPTVDSL